MGVLLFWLNFVVFIVCMLQRVCMVLNMFCTVVYECCVLIMCLNKIGLGVWLEE